MSDYISRQAAIDAIMQKPAWHGSDGSYYHSSDIRQALESLPSAQTETILCKDCKWCEDADGLICKNIASWVIATDYDFGCVCGEREEDEQIH